MARPVASPADQQAVRGGLAAAAWRDVDNAAVAERTAAQLAELLASERPSREGSHMRILVVNLHFSPDLRRRAPTVIAEETASELAAAGHSVVVFTGRATRASRPVN